MRSRAIAVGAVLGGAVVTGGWLVQAGLDAKVTRGGAGDSPRLFQQVLAHIEQHYVDPIPDSALYHKAVDGLLLELHDPHSVYLTRDRLARLNESTTGQYAGVGIQMDLRDGWITVVTPLPGTPAEKAGLLTGDRVVEIEGKSTRGWTSDEATKALRGTPGSRVRVVVERPGSAARLPFTLARQEIHFRSVQHALMLDDGVGYVDLSVFADSSTDELRASIDSLQRAGMRSLVFDLRGDPGGLLDQGVAIADLFLDPGQLIVSMRGRTAGANHSFADRLPQRWPTLPLVVLVDSGSASAAEIVSGALQDHDRALLVGTTSYGKGSAQSLFPVAAGALKLTTALWYTPSGRSINRLQPSVDDDDGNTPALEPLGEHPSRPMFRTDGGRTVLGGGGITPDVIVPDSTVDARAVALERALGKHVGALRDAMTALALETRARGTLKSPAFTVTPEMRAALYDRLTTRGVVIPRPTFDAAAPLIDRLLGYQLARYVFGPAAEFARITRDDVIVRRATELLRGVATQHDLLARADAPNAPRSSHPSAGRS